MRVDKHIMYHISRENNWNVGDMITAGIDYNPFWLACLDYSPKVSINNHVMSIHEMIEKKIAFGVSQQNIDFLYKKLRDVSKEFSFLVRELVFEDYRKANFPDLPSRQKCLWTTESTKLPYWKTMSQNTQRSLLTLELEGELFCADEHWLKADTFSAATYLERAKHYWAGDMSSSPIKEYLFSGIALVKEIQPI